MSRLRVAQTLTAATFLFATFALYGHQSAGIATLTTALAALLVGWDHFEAWLNAEAGPRRRSGITIRVVPTDGIGSKYQP